MDATKNWWDQICSINVLIKGIQNSGFENDPLISAVLKTLPEQAVERGILSEVALRQRFKRVENVAHRLAMLKNEGPYPGVMFILSYLRSMLTVRPPFSIDTTTLPHGLLEELDNADILYRAR